MERISEFNFGDGECRIRAGSSREMVKDCSDVTLFGQSESLSFGIVVSGIRMMCNYRF